MMSADWRSPFEFDFDLFTFTLNDSLKYSKVFLIMKSTSAIVSNEERNFTNQQH
jgi:hypothetical protein